MAHFQWPKSNKSATAKRATHELPTMRPMTAQNAKFPFIYKERILNNSEFARTIELLDFFNFLFDLSYLICNFSYLYVLQNMSIIQLIMQPKDWRALLADYS